jgi:hypothetical protein
MIRPNPTLTLALMYYVSFPADCSSWLATYQRTTTTLLSHLSLTRNHDRAQIRLDDGEYIDVISLFSERARRLVCHHMGEIPASCNSRSLLEHAESVCESVGSVWLGKLAGIYSGIPRDYSGTGTRLKTRLF